MILNKKKKYLVYFLIFLTYFSFIIGFIFDENSAGGGSYNGDLTWIWGNLEIFKNNDLLIAINHPDLFGNRTPLHYMLHKIFNPFINNIDTYRTSVFFISLTGPLIFYLCLKQKFEKVDKLLLILISSILFLSPYYRTSAYWGLEENYSIITMLLSFLFLENYLKKNDKNLNLYINLFLTILFSSVCIYFDQKFLIVPTLCFLKIIFSTHNKKIILFTFFSYLLLSVPYILLIISWGGIAPPLTQEMNLNTITSISRFNNFYYGHIGYATTIIALYIFPLLLFKEKDLLTVVNRFFYEKKNLLIVSFFIIYLIYLIFEFNYEKFTIDDYWIGLGFIHKISITLFSEVYIQKVFTYFAFFISWIIIIIHINKNLKDFYIIIYFYFISVLLWPLMQEYFDPFIILLCFLSFSHGQA